MVPRTCVVAASERALDPAFELGEQGLELGLVAKSPVGRGAARDTSRIVLEKLVAAYLGTPVPIGAIASRSGRENRSRFVAHRKSSRPR